MPREFLDVDPQTLRLPTARLGGAAPAKLRRQIAQHATSTAGMPPLLVSRGTDGELAIIDGVTRATRVAKLLPGTTVRVEVIDEPPESYGGRPTVGERLP